MITSTQIQDFVGVPADGKWGPKTAAACIAKLQTTGASGIASWPRKRLVIGIQQMMLDKFYEGAVDGFAGPAFRAALEAYQNSQVVKDAKSKGAATDPRSPWPRQADVPDFYGAVGENQAMLELPYPVKLAWDTGTVFHRMSLHKKVAVSAGRALKAALDHYGDEQIAKLGLDLWGGSLNVRKMRGGNSYSMHSWGIAIDWDPDHNEMRMDHTKARFAKPVYEPWFDAWYAEGWISLGKERDFDWMHVQAARL